jgi:hypothetical protein
MLPARFVSAQHEIAILTAVESQSQAAELVEQLAFDHD